MAEGAPTELPLRALGALPQLRQLTVNEARLQLRAPLPALPLLALELAADALAELPPRAFRALPQLRRLGLWANALTDLPEDTFEGIFIPTSFYYIFVACQPDGFLFLVICRFEPLCSIERPRCYRHLYSRSTKYRPRAIYRSQRHREVWYI